MGRKSLLLFVLAAILVAVSVFLFIFRHKGAVDHIVVTYDEVISSPSKSAVYRSINNWETVEETGVTGAALYAFLEARGVEDNDAEVKLIAPDGYFWPAVDTALTLSDLKKPNENGLYPMLIWEMNGATLEPEPDGSGPLRLVMPQYGEDDVNKPSWVSNVRLIEIGPVEEAREAPGASEVPLDEIWIYGDIPAVYPFSVLLPVIVLLAGIAIAAGAVISRTAAGRKKRGATQTGAVFIISAMLASAFPLALAGQDCCRADPGSFVFSRAELVSMPAFAGHYTFLKSQEPYTYYEADYKGVSLSYLIDEKLSLAPGATGIQVKARDGYNVSLSISQVRAVYPGGLKVIIAYDKNGSPLKGDEGSLRLIVPQSVAGDKEQGGEANTPLCARMIYAVEVLPLPAGVQPPAASNVPEGSLAVYGAVVDLPESAPAPDTTVPQPLPSVEAQPGDDPDIPPGTIQEGQGAADNDAMAIFLSPSGAFLLQLLAMTAAHVQPLRIILPIVYCFQYQGGQP
jgi:DMSO/TMAO reductase YedYZ molybdopterin-dependent catalytic subunit